MPVITSGPVPVLLTVTGIAAEGTPTGCGGNASGLGVITHRGNAVLAGAAESDGLWGADGVVRDGDIGGKRRTAFGVKVTLMVQLCPAVSGAPQVPAGTRLNSAASAPARVIAMPVSEAVPLLVRVTDFAGRGNVQRLGRERQAGLLKLAIGTAPWFAMAATLRTRIFCESPISRSPAPSNVNPCGKLSLADVARPPSPAKPASWQRVPATG